MYGTIRVQQEVNYPGCVIGTLPQNPGFLALRASGLEVARVTEPGEFATDVRRALVDFGASLIEIVTDPRALCPTGFLG